MIKNNRSAFTLAEMMIVMLILTILLAAFAPLMTKKSKVDLSNPWRWAANNSDIYYGMGNSQTALLGKNSKAAADPNAALIIKTNGRPLITLENANGTHDYDKYVSLFADKGTAIHDSGFWDYGKLCFSGTGKDNYDCGDASVSYGYGSLEANTTGSRNSAFGINTLMENTTGSDNVAVGVRALSINKSGSENVAIGHRAMRYSMWGSRNVAIGKNALQYLYHYDNPSASDLSSYANDNVAIGYEAGSGVQTGHDVVAVGKDSCKYANGSNQICIGSNSGPEQYGTGAGSPNYIWLGDRSSSNVTLYLGNRTLTQIISSVSSDKRLKNISGESKYGLDVVRNLKTYKYTYKDDKDKTQHVGVIAQDLQKYIPEAIEKDKKGYLSIYKEYVVYSMFNAIKELDKMVQDLVAQVKTVAAQAKDHDAQIKALQKENKELKTKLNNLEKRLNALEKKL